MQKVKLGILLVFVVFAGIAGQTIAYEMRRNAPIEAETSASPEVKALSISQEETRAAEATTNPDSHVQVATKVIPPLIPTGTPQSIYIPTPSPFPPMQNGADSAVKIELCKTEADRHKIQTKTALVLVYNQDNADAVKIANTSSVDELVNVGISLGLLTQDEYNYDPSGHQLVLLKLREKVMGEIKSFMDTVNAKGDVAYNDYYLECLSK